MGVEKLDRVAVTSIGGEESVCNYNQYELAREIEAYDAISPACMQE